MSKHFLPLFLSTVSFVLFGGSSAVCAQEGFKGAPRAPNPTVNRRTGTRQPTLNEKVEMALEQGNRARDKGNAEDLDLAEKFYKKALALNPKEARAYVGLGNVEMGYDYVPDEGGGSTAWDEGKKRAEGYYRKALEINPEYYDAYLGLAWVHYLVQAYAEAEQEFKKAISLRPNNPNNSDAFRGLGQLYENQQRYADAIAAYRERSRLEPDEVFLHYHLGTLYLKLKNKSAAMEEYQVLLKMEARKKPDAGSEPWSSQLLREINKL